MQEVVKANQQEKQLANAKEEIKGILSSFLNSRIAAYFPKEFLDSSTLTTLDLTGVTGNFFKVEDSFGKHIFVKVRPLSQNELEPQTEYQSGAVTKESYFLEVCDKINVPAVGTFASKIIPRADLPEALDNFVTPSFPGREKDLLISLQNFANGLEGYFNYDNAPLQTEVHRNLGRVLSKINQIPVFGYGSNFDSKTASFTSTWAEYLVSFNLNEQISGLKREEILSDNDVKQTHQLLEPLYNLNPRSVLLHTDTNPGNYKYKPDGSIAAILDADRVTGGPWQYEAGVGLVRIAGSTFRMSAEGREKCSQAFLEGYGELADVTTNKATIDAFSIANCLKRMHSVYILRGEPYNKGAYLALADDTYVSGKLEHQADFEHAVLGRELLLRSLI